MSQVALFYTAAVWLQLDTIFYILIVYITFNYYR